MKKALVGYTGFVGSNINEFNNFDYLYNSSNFEFIQNQEFDLLIFAGLPGEKWRANLYPEKDLANIENIIKYLASVKAKKFILISTIDVYPFPVDCDEKTFINKYKSSYGMNRYVMEQYIKNNFKDSMILRLPALFGTGLKKNILFDLINNNRIDKINIKSKLQWYDLSRLNEHIDRLISQNFSGCINLVSEPIKISDIVNSFFDHYKIFNDNNEFQNYDIKSIHAKNLEGKNNYISSKKEIMMAMKIFIDKNKK